MTILVFLTAPKIPNRDMRSVAMNPKFALSFPLYLAVASVALHAPQSAAATIKVGVILPYSGAAAQEARLIDRGMQLYIKLHAKEIAPHKVELIKRDSKHPGGEIAKVATRELVTRERVKILTGYTYSPNAIASASIATKANVPMILVNAATAWIPQISPYIARVSWTMWQAAYPLGTYAAKKLGCKTAAIGYTDFPPGKDARNAFKMAFEKAGGKVLDAIPMGGPREVPDYTPFYQRVRNAKADCFFVFVPGGAHSTAAAKTFKRLGMDKAGIRMIATGDLTQDTRLDDMGEAAVGMITVHHYSAHYDTAANKAFVAEWKKAYGADSVPDFFAVQGYDAMAAVFQIIKKLGSDINGKKAMAVLAGWSFQSPRGKVTIDEKTRDIIQDQNVHEVIAKDGKIVIRVIDSFPQLKDPCKELKVGRCGKQ